jgi:hypothetical protein
MSLPSVHSSSFLAERVRKILSTRGLSLADLSRASRGNRLGHIPHSFYSSLRKRSFSPSLYQLHSLSALSGYRLVDWLALFGISLDDASRFQLFFPSLRTVELDARAYGLDTVIPGFMTSRKWTFQRRSLPSASGSALVHRAGSIRSPIVERGRFVT